MQDKKTKKRIILILLISIIAIVATSVTIYFVTLEKNYTKEEFLALTTEQKITLLSDKGLMIAEKLIDEEGEEYILEFVEEKSTLILEQSLPVLSPISDDPAVNMLVLNIYDSLVELKLAEDIFCCKYFIKQREDPIFNYTGGAMVRWEA